MSHHDAEHCKEESLLWLVCLRRESVAMYFEQFFEDFKH